MPITKRLLVGIAVVVTALSLSAVSFAQDTPTASGEFEGPYFGQKTPGLVPEFFADGIVNTPMGMHGNVVFSPDLQSAFWHPDRPMGLYFSEMRDGVWTDPVELNFVNDEMHDAPCLSHDGRRLYFSAAPLGASGKTEHERLYYVDKRVTNWSEPHLLDSVFDALKLHWQFDVDADGNVYVGGGPVGSSEKSDIYFSRYENGRYATPVRLPGTINTDGGEFSPCLAPDGSYLIFNRADFPPNARPQVALYISFKQGDGQWGDAISLSDILGSQGWDLNCRVSPDGKYLLFMSMRDGRNGTYWIDSSVLDQLK